MVDGHPAHHQLPNNKPVFVAFCAIGNLYKEQVVVSD
jgi:hypothetical protein